MENAQPEVQPPATPSSMRLGVGIALLVAILATTLVVLLIVKSQAAKAEPNNPENPLAALQDQRPLLATADAAPIAVDTVDKPQLVRKDLPVKNIAYGDLVEQKLDIYGPKDASNAPVMLYVHGGGWTIGWKSMVREMPEAFAEKGWIFISIRYRLSPAVEHPEHVRDVAKAIAWTLDHIAEYGGDQSQLYLMGHSAGAHLVSLVATDQRRLAEWGKSPRDIRGVFANDVAMYDITKAMERKGYRATLTPIFGNTPAGWVDASPQHFIAKDKGIPPFLVSYSRGLGLFVDDFWGDAGKSFAQALRGAGVETTLFNGQDRSHLEINRRIGDKDDDLTRLMWQKLAEWRRAPQD